jgi:DNA-binding NarL/FixJ family response regulator
VIADDVAALRYLWRVALEDDPDFEVVAEAADGVETLAAVERTRPEVVLLDLSMPEMDGLEVIPVLRTASSRLKIVVASSFAASRMAPRAFELGADAYFEKGRPLSQLTDTLRGICGAGAHAAG